jgi:hypothetical protein
MKLVRYCPVERRVWIATQRCHHGAVGCLAIVLGALLVIHDRHDYRVWFVRERGTLI